MDNYSNINGLNESDDKKSQMYPDNDWTEIPMNINNDENNNGDKNEDDDENWNDIMEETAKIINNNDSFIPKDNIVRKSSINNKNKFEETKQSAIEHIDIDDIYTSDITTCDDLNLLEKSSMIAKNLKFQFNKRYNENSNTFMIWMMKSLVWLKNIMYELATRNYQIDDKISNTDKEFNIFNDSLINTSFNPSNGVPIMQRNSYMFCEFGSTCRFNYNIDQKCYAQHYVYNLVYLDVLDILNYIVCMRRTNGTSYIIIEDQDMIEIKISINTITYVINHMYDELSHLKITNSEWYQNYEKRIYGNKFTSTLKNKSVKRKNSESSNNLLKNLSNKNRDAISNRNRNRNKNKSKVK
jgi:hypothetical protein